MGAWRTGGSCHRTPPTRPRPLDDTRMSAPWSARLSRAGRPSALLFRAGFGSGRFGTCRASCRSLGRRSARLRQAAGEGIEPLAQLGGNRPATGFDLVYASHSPLPFPSLLSLPRQRHALEEFIKLLLPSLGLGGIVICGLQLFFESAHEFFQRSEILPAIFLEQLFIDFTPLETPLQILENQVARLSQVVGGRSGSVFHRIKFARSACVTRPSPVSIGALPAVGWQHGTIAIPRTWS